MRTHFWGEIHSLPESQAIEDFVLQMLRMFFRRHERQQNAPRCKRLLFADYPEFVRSSVEIYMT